MAINFSDLGGGGGGKFQKTEIITSTQSWTVPADVTELEVVLCGGGGGGGHWSSNNNDGGAGGGGSASYAILPVTSGASYTITLGAGGTKGNNSNGSNGANSTFGALLTATGGGGGYRRYAGGGKPGGTHGGGGGGGHYHETGNSIFTSDGLKGIWGVGGGGGGSSSVNYASRHGSGQDGGGYGADGIYQGWVAEEGRANSGGGGGGGCSATWQAANGGSGVCIIKYWTAG